MDLDVLYVYSSPTVACPSSSTAPPPGSAGRLMSLLLHARRQRLVLTGQQGMEEARHVQRVTGMMTTMMTMFTVTV